MRYAKQVLAGGDLTGFRNSDDEPWAYYKTSDYGAVLSFDKDGHYPQPDWTAVTYNIQTDRFLLPSGEPAWPVKRSANV